MTTTTRKTGSIARVLAALVAVLALVGMSLAFTAGAANADGDKIWICHADTNNNGDHGLADGTGGEFGAGYNLIEVAQSAADNAHFKLHPMDKPATQLPDGSYTCGTVPPPPDKKVDVCHVMGNGQFQTLNISENALQAHLDHGDTAGACVYTATKDFPDLQVCFGGSVTTVIVPGATTRTSAVSTDDATAQVNAAFDAEYAAAKTAALAGYSGWTAVPAGGVCTTTPTNPTNPTNPTTTVTPEAAAVVPEAATAVESATVVAPEAATVAVPAPAKVTAPATVPAGDGSSVPQVPTWALALLVLGTVGLAASATRLVTAR